MAEPPPNGKQLTKKYNPSRLRNQICPDSTDDERGPENHTIQEPHSDTVVPETQLEHHERIDDFYRDQDNCSDYGDVPLSPNSFAMLERTAIKKTTETTTPAPPVVKLLTKEDFGLDETSTPSLFSFSFRNARKVPSERMSTEQAALPQSVTQTTLTETVEKQPGKQVSNDLNPVTSLTAPSPPEPLNQVQNQTDGIASASHATNTAPCGSVTSHTKSALNASYLDISSSAPPGIASVNGSQTVRTVKRVKRSKHGPTTRQRSGIWPPRPKANIYHAGNMSPIDQTWTTVSTTLDDSSMFDQRGLQVLDSVGENTYTLPANLDCRDDKHVQDTYRPQEATHTNMQHDTQGSSTMLHIPKAPSCLTTIPPQPILSQFPEHSTSGSFQHTSIIAPQQQIQDGVMEAAANTINSVGDVSPERIISSQYHDPRSYEWSNTATNSTAGLEEHSHRSSSGVYKSSARRTETEIAPYQTSNQNGTYRVGKLRKKALAASRSSPLHTQGPMLSSNVERSVESLRIALLADQFRTHHSNTTSEKHHEETVDRLQDIISMQKETIAEWKGRHQELGVTLARLTEKAKTNQKYATGLQKDYEKLRKSVTCFHDQGKSTLREKIAEVEREKDSLRRNFEITLDTLSKSQKNMKSTVDDFYVQLMITESKKRQLVKDLDRQTAMYEEERKKRDDLEKQLLSSVEGTQRQLCDTSSTLVDKLKTLQDVTDKMTADNGRDAKVTECLDILRKLQMTPNLTTEDIGKAEKMLQSLHECINSGFEKLSEAVNSNDSPTNEIQTFITSQLDKIQLEMLKYDDVVAENRKASESNNEMTKQLEAEKQQSRQLNEQIKNLQLTEIDLKARAAQLESELIDTRDNAHEPEPLELNQEFIDLRQELKKAQDDLIAADKRAEEKEQLRKEFEQEAARQKTRYEKAKEFLLNVSTKQGNRAQPTSIGNITELREQITNELRKEHSDRESGHKNEIHRLTHERNEKEQALQDQGTETLAAKTKLQEMRKNWKTLSSELEDANKDKADLKAKLETAQRTAKDMTFQSSLTTELEQRLRQKSEELSSKARDYSKLESQYADVSTSMRDLQSSHDYLENQVSQHASSIAISRQENDNKLSETQDRAQNTLQLAQDQISVLQKRHQELLSNLEQSQSSETELRNAQTTYIKERISLQQQLTDIQAAQDAKDADILRIRADNAEEIRKLTNTHQAQTHAWNQRLTQNDTALKKAEAGTRRVRDESRAKIESDRKVAEKNLELVRQEYEKQLQEARVEARAVHFQTSHGSNMDNLNSLSLPDIHSDNTMRKVHRQNHSVLNNFTFSKPQDDASTPAQSGLPWKQREDSELSFNLFENVNRDETGFFDESTLSLVDPAAEHVPETQEFVGLAMSPRHFDEEMDQVSPRQENRKDRSSTELTVVDSDEMTEMEQNMLRNSAPKLRGHDRSSRKDKNENSKELAMLLGNSSISGSNSSRSQERPRSQANTASRMMPPPELTNPHFNSPTGVVAAKKPMKCDSLYDEADRNISSNGIGTTETVGSVASTSKRTYGHNRSRLDGCKSRKEVTLRDSDSTSSQKRKSSVEDILQDTAKKQRTASQYSRNIPSSGSESRSYSAHPSSSAVVGLRSKVQLGSPSTVGSSATTNRSKARSGSSGVPHHTSNKLSSSSDVYQPCGQQLLSPQLPLPALPRRVTSRITRSKSKRSGTAYEGRFSQELGRP